MNYLAEAVRFELTEGYKPSTVFKTVALNRSATLPLLEVGHIISVCPFCQAFWCLMGLAFCFYCNRFMRRFARAETPIRFQTKRRH